MGLRSFNDFAAAHCAALGMSPAELAALADTTASPYEHRIEGGGARTLAYRAQYFDARLRLGPLSAPASATATL